MRERGGCGGGDDPRGAGGDLRVLARCSPATSQAYQRPGPDRAIAASRTAAGSSRFIDDGHARGDSSRAGERERRSRWCGTRDRVAWASAFVGVRAASRQLSPEALALGRLDDRQRRARPGRPRAPRAAPSRRDLPAIASAVRLVRRVQRRTERGGARRSTPALAAMLVNIGPILIALLAGLVLREGSPAAARRVRVAFAGAVVIGSATSKHGIAPSWSALLCGHRSRPLRGRRRSAQSSLATGHASPLCRSPGSRACSVRARVSPVRRERLAHELPHTQRVGDRLDGVPRDRRRWRSASSPGATPLRGRLRGSWERRCIRDTDGDPARLGCCWTRRRPAWRWWAGVLSLAGVYIAGASAVPAAARAGRRSCRLRRRACRAGSASRARSAARRRPDSASSACTPSSAISTTSSGRTNTAIPSRSVSRCEQRLGLPAQQLVGQALEATCRPSRSPPVSASRAPRWRFESQPCRRPCPHSAPSTTRS